MAERFIGGDWTDRYLRHELAPEEEAEFETALLDSSELQHEVETALALRRALELGAEHSGDTQAVSSPVPYGAGRWQPLALAASLVLAVFSTVMYWRAGNEVAGLESELAYSQQPFSRVLTVPVDIMRSAGSQEPDVMVRLPQGKTLILLDIEASSALAGHAELELALRRDDRKPALHWQSDGPVNGRVRTALDARSLQSGRYWLELADATGKVLDRRLIEFQ